MSYELVKSIKIDEENEKVFITCASNNVRPITYSKENYPYYSNLLKEKGKQAVELALLKGYESGSLQRGDNKYRNARKVLVYIFSKEYAKFNWRNSYEDSDKQDELRKSKEFDELLLRALNYKIPKERYVLTKDSYGEKVYGKRCPTCMKWLYCVDKATKYLFEEEAKQNIFNEFKDEWKVEVVNKKWKNEKENNTLKVWC